MRIAVTNLKGGSGKTTTSMYLAHALTLDGPTLLVDADPQGSALSWSEAADDLPFPTVSLPVKNLHRQLDSIAAAYDHVVIDTPPGHPAITASAAQAVNLAIVPVQPSILDLDRIDATIELIRDAQVLNESLRIVVLLTRVTSGTKSQRDIRQVLTEDGLTVLDTEIPQRQSVALAGGTVLTKLDVYEPLLTEIRKVTI